MTIIEPSDVQPGDTIRIVTKRREVAVTEEGVVGKIIGTNGLTAYTEDGAYIGRLDRFPAPDCIVYLLHRPKPAPKPKQLADLQPGLVIDNRGDSWVFDGAYAYRAAHNGRPSRMPMDEGRSLAPWKQEATLDYNVEPEAATRDLAEAAGKRTEYGIRFGDGEVKLRPTAYEAVEEAKKLSKMTGSDNYVEPVTRTNWGSAESAWVVIEVATTPTTCAWCEDGVRDHEGQRAWVSRDLDGHLRIGVEEESAYLTQKAADSLIRHLTELAGGA